MKYKVNNRDVTITKANFISSGGEGSVYAKDNVAYKIYTDPAKMMPQGKIHELSVITDDNIIRPKDIVYNNKTPVGYSMRFVKNTYALCQLFTKAFREREGLDHDGVQNLVKDLHKLVKHVHSKDILIVDLNEMNFLVNKDMTEIYAIDTDSYQTKHYPATAIMESIRDRHSKRFSKDTDWFSYAIITFQLFIGIHPYKGKHPSIKTMDARMLGNVSIFNKDVSIPKVCYSIDVIPQVYKDWFRAVFDDGKRLPPPESFSNAVHVIEAVIKKITGSNNFDIREEREFDGNILSLIFRGGKRAVLTNKSFYLGYKGFKTSGAKIVFTQSDIPILAKITDERLKLFNTELQKEIPNQIGGSDLMTYNGSLYVKNEESLLEVDFTEIKNNIFPSGKVVANVLENASRLYDGVLVQNILGDYFFSMFPEHGVHRQVAIKELAKYKVLDAKFDSNVLMVVVAQSGVYDRFVFRFSPSWDSYDVRQVENITPAGLNFVVLDSGICISITEDENVELFSSKKDSHNIKEIDDPVITSNMKLFKSAGLVYLTQHNKLYSIKMI